MPDHLDALTNVVQRKLAKLPSVPSRAVLRQLLETMYLATLKTEEGKPTRGAITFANPVKPNPDAPPLLRAHYPAFTPFGAPIDFTVPNLVKLSRAIDSWAGAIAVYGRSKSGLQAWGVLDQLVHRNVHLHHESDGAFSPPGVLSVHMDGIGALSVYHGGLFLASLQQDRLVRGENDAFGSDQVADRVLLQLAPFAAQIAAAIGEEGVDSESARLDLGRAWRSTISRLCIGLRRIGTGGAFLLTPEPIDEYLSVGTRLEYGRLRDSFLLSVLDNLYLNAADERLLGRAKTSSREAILEYQFAAEDAEDRKLELSGAVRFVTSLGAVDGLVLMGTTLEVRGYGVKIKSPNAALEVFDGPSFARRGAAATRVDVGRFGTRHGSMLQYCNVDPSAIGVVVSQDGAVRLITRVGPHLTFWDDVKLLDYQDDHEAYLAMERRARSRRAKGTAPQSRGYSEMPKTLEELAGFAHERPRAF